MAIWQNVAGAWKSGNYWQNIAGTWKQVNVWQNVQGVWKNLSVQFTPADNAPYYTGSQFTSGTLTCSQPAVWTYSTVSGNGGQVSIGSGQTATQITFSNTSQGSAPNRQGRTQTWNVRGVSNGVTRDFQVTVEALGDNL